MGVLFCFTEVPLEDLVAEAKVCGADSRATIEIIRRFEPLTKRLGARFAAGRSHRDDVENAARYALTRAIQRHHGAIETFPAYAKRYMAGAASRELGHWLPPADTATIPIGEVAHQDMSKMIAVEASSGHAGWADGDTADVIAKLDCSRQRLLARRYITDADLAEIAAEAGTSVSAVSQRLSATRRQLRTMLAA